MKTEIIYFETEEYCDKFRKSQKCIVRKYYDKTTKSYYLFLTSKRNLFNTYQPNLTLLDRHEKIYNDYCHIVKRLEKCTKYNFLSQNEKEFLPKFLETFNSFRDDMREKYPFHYVENRLVPTEVNFKLKSGKKIKFKVNKVRANIRITRKYTL